MPITVNRKNVRFNPDPKRVIARFFMPGDHERGRTLIQKVLVLSEEDVNTVFNQVLRGFSRRHRNITNIFKTHFENIRHLFEPLNINPDTLSLKRQLLIGSYFTMEYSIESAAFFNPSIVEDPDQSNLREKGQKRVIVSFRATGEGHISSIAFRSGIIDQNNNIDFIPGSNLVDKPQIIKRHVYDKKQFIKKLKEMKVQKDVVGMVMEPLGDTFIYGELQASIHECSQNIKLSYSKQQVLQAIHWLASSHYEITFSLDTAISERVLYPISYTESNGIEDARFVRFVDDDGSVTYYATYTAFNGFTILPKLLETKDFYQFKISPINGEYAQNKGMALFPRKIRGKYVMASRYDGVNNYIMCSDDIKLWRNVHKIEEPVYPWEFVQIGNSGSPLETDKGWLLLTHGVGPMRRYCLGAILLDLDDPTKVIAHLKEPLLVPNEEEREGYVPNVLYSCGSILHNNEVIIPYAMSDTCSTYATIPLEEVFDELLKSSRKPRSAVTPKAASVLVVDDEPMVQKFITFLLNDEGYHVEVASDGAEALLSLGGKRFDLILMDVNMPNLDGVQLMKILRTKKLSTPVIVLSGDDKVLLKEKGLDLDSVDFVDKPIKTEILLPKIKRLLKKGTISTA
jgi:beta-1,2-mannobiose phosphorylase / 1,2-beta-oligomannan phosphorylase